MHEASMTHAYRILDPSHPSSTFAGKCALTVMAKAPRPGKVKTRLNPPLTPMQASELNACFLRDTVASLQAVSRTAPAEWVISYTPVGEEEAFRGILDVGALLLPQRGESFGERLVATAEDLFACGFSAVCLIDSDSPTVPTSEFVRATELLLAPGRRAVLGTSEDGGYYLIGLQRSEARPFPEVHLFKDITWSTDVVSAQTQERAQEIHLPIELLREWYDVDDAYSLARLQAELFDPTTTRPKGNPAPETRQYLSKLGSLASITIPAIIEAESPA